MAHEVVFAPEGLADLASLYDHLADAASPARALACVEQVRTYCLDFATFPERGTRRDELRPGVRTIGYRRRVNIAFHNTAEPVAIDRILYGGRDVAPASRTRRTLFAAGWRPYPACASTWCGTARRPQSGGGRAASCRQPRGSLHGGPIGLTRSSTERVETPWIQASRTTAVSAFSAMRKSRDPMLINGKCHCGNIYFSLDWPGDTPDISARACGCTFCIKHGGVWTSKPGATLSVRVHDRAISSNYAFGTQTATFHVCSRCGAVPFVSSEIENRLYAVVNVNTFEGVDSSLLRRSDSNFEAEDTASRLSRRARNWIDNVHIDEDQGAG